MIRLLAIVVLFVFAACSRSAPAAASAPSATPATQSAPAPEAPPKPVPAQLPDVLARVNGHAINRAEFETALGQLEARAGRPVPPEQRDRVLRGVLDELVAYQLLLQESNARKIVVPDSEIDARLAEIRKQFPSDEAFQQTLEQRKMTVAGVRTTAREGLQIDKMLEAEFATKGDVTPEQISDFYTKNPKEFQQGERARASHILIRFPQSADAAAKEQARGKAAGVLAELKEGKDFAALAKDRSEDPGSAVNGGDLGYFERGQMVGPFEEAVFSLPVTQTSELVETQFGYHIIRVADRKPARTVPLEEVRNQIESFLADRNREQQTMALLDSLKAKGKVELLM